MKERINGYHIAILMYMIQSSITLYSLPRLCAERFGTNGWLSIFILSGVAMLNIYLISLVFRWGQGKSAFEILESFLPKWISNPLYGLLAVFWAFVGCVTLKHYVLIYQMLSFPNTNPLAFKLALDVLAFFLVVKGIYNILKAVTLFFYFSIWMVGLYIFLIPDFEWDRFTRFLFQGQTDFLYGSADIFIAFIGYEVCLFLFPYVDRQSRWFRSVYIGNLITTLVYFLTCFTAFGIYSFNQLKQLFYPTLEMISYVKLPFVERIDTLLFTFFIFKILTSTVVYLWMAVETLQRISSKIKSNWSAFILLAFSSSISTIPTVLRELEAWTRWVGYVQIGIAFSLPLALLVILLIKRGKWRCNA